MDPTLCSKCSPATKYFCSPEPVVQELYKKSCYWKQVPGSTLSMDIEPYKTLKAPYYYMENLGIKHPQIGQEDRYTSRGFSEFHKETKNSHILQK